MVTLVVASGKAAWRKYSQELGKRLEVNKLRIRPSSSLLEALVFIGILRKNNDLVHLPFYYLARCALLSNTPFITTIHDILNLTHRFGSDSSRTIDRIYYYLDRVALKKAKHVIAVSETTKNDLVNFGVPRDKITVTLLGVDHNIYYPRDQGIFDFRYVLYVGSERPNKNFVGLVKAFSELKKRNFDNLKLIKIGDLPGEERYRIKSLQMIDELDLTRDVIFTGWVEEQELPVYYSNAECFVFPSFYEGFGLPPLEAMACGCPAIVSNTGALPEVVGDAGMMVSPHDVDGLAEAILEVLTNERLRQGMIERGLKRSGKFTWERTVMGTYEVYNKIACGYK